MRSYLTTQDLPQVIPIFPLDGAILLPGGELPLRIFEPRYVELMRECLNGAKEFGVVLIAAGREVGGDDARCDVGTMAHIVDCQSLGEGRYLVECEMRDRIRVTSWLADELAWPVTPGVSIPSSAMTSTIRTATRSGSRSRAIAQPSTAAAQATVSRAPRPAARFVAHTSRSRPVSAVTGRP